MVRIGKEFHWEMAHRLPYHKAGCENIHGHSYRLWVELEGEADERGMVMDYGDLKVIVKPLIDALDHCFLCSTDDRVMIDFLKGQTFKVVYVDFPTTAENLTFYFLHHIKERVRDHNGLKTIRIRVCETASSYAEITEPLKTHG